MKLLPGGSFAPLRSPAPYMHGTVYAWHHIHGAIYAWCYICGAVYTWRRICMAPHMWHCIHMVPYTHGTVYTWCRIHMASYTFVGKFRGTHHLCWAKACCPHSQWEVGGNAHQWLCFRDPTTAPYLLPSLPAHSPHSQRNKQR